jgi:hypothetical protein
MKSDGLIGAASIETIFLAESRFGTLRAEMQPDDFDALSRKLAGKNL